MDNYPTVVNSKSIKNSTIQEALECLKKLMRQDWKPFSESKGIVITTTNAPSNMKCNFPPTKTEMLVPEGIYPFATLNVAGFADALPEFDNDTEMIEIVNVIDGVVKIHAVIKSPWPVSPREIVCDCSPFMYDDDLQCFMTIQRSVTHPDFPPNSNGNVTAKVHVIAQMVKETSKHGEYKAIHVQCVDPNGDIPTLLSPIISKKGAMHPKNVFDFVQKVGCPPALHGSYLSKLDLQFKKKKYSGIYILPDGFACETIIDPNFYNTGVQLKVSDNVVVKRTKLGFSICSKGTREVRIELIPLKYGKAGDFLQKTFDDEQATSPLKRKASD